MNLLKARKQKSLFKIILISSLSLFALIVLFFTSLFVLFLIYKNDISKTLLSSVNQKINGEITFSDLSFTPFIHFPSASLKLSDLSLKESKDSSVNAGKMPVFNVKEAYISLNIIDLFSSRINVSEITFEVGSLNIIVYPDSQTNLQKALKIKSGTEKIVKEETADTVTDTTSGLNLQIDNLEIIDLQLALENQLKKNKLQLKINELQSEFSYSENKIISSLNLDASIDSLIKNNGLLLSNQQINFESKIEVDTDSIYVKLEEGSFSIGEAKFNFNGIFDSKNQGYVDLSVFVSDKDFSIFSLFLRDDELKNIKAGDLYLDGSVKGKTLIEFPQAEISFGLKNVELINPITKRKIKNLNLKGYFNSGRSDDWFDARLRVDTLFADFPDGLVKLSGSVRNYKLPELDINIFLSADVTGLEKVFKLGSISDLKGKIELTDRVMGKYLIEEKKFVSSINNAKLSLENFGVNIPGTIVFDKVNGIIRRESDDIYFDSLSIISEDTDILINGKVQNLIYLFFNIEKDIEGNLDIKSSVFDLPNFLAFDPSIKRDFNYRILDVDVSVIARTTTSKATKFKSFPEIDFDIKKLDATVKNFLPRLEIYSGIYKISESILGFNMKFENFKTDFMGGKFNYSAEYNTSKYQPYYIKMRADFKKIYLSELFYSENDTVPESINGKLSGSFFTEFQFPTDSTLLKFIKLKNADMVYEFSKDTITATNLSFEFKDFYFNDKAKPNPLATLYTSGDLKADNINSSSFNFSDVDFNMNVINGDYEVKSETVRLFGENAKGHAKITATPFSDVPKFNITYTDINFLAEKMLSTFMEDQVISGPLNLSFNVSSSGSEWDTIVSNMSGAINLSGKNLLLNGLDADEMIDKFKRSQNFNLVDLGAVVLAGPVGLAVTKGTDFASIFVFNSGKSTKINELVSHWTISKGVFEIQDAAFTTNTNRIALTGLIGFANQNIDLTIALLDKSGCSIFSQQVYGNLDSPTMGKVKVVGTVLAPVTNLVDDVTGKDCVVFYQGSVEHPKK
ncbi:MAG TPA: AsmA-like C-terminal region-containing protein [Ignavibacteriaceae bacterium]|nr:AsmA-like C-terminal region-containing protein [Ignavibacteriaceae bacterium]